jgi:hypothetical protein
MLLFNLISLSLIIKVYNSLKIQGVSRIRGPNYQIRIAVSIEINTPRQGESEPSQLRINVACEDCLTGVVIDTLGASSENVDCALLILPTVGCTCGEIFVAVLIEVAKT